MSPRLDVGTIQPPIRSVPGTLFLGVSSPDLKLTTRFQLVPRSRNSGSVHLLPLKPYGVPYHIIGGRTLLLLLS
jgi:hypothetical protein